MEGGKYVLIEKIYPRKNTDSLIILKQGWGAGAGCFWLLRAGTGAAWKKNQEPETEPRAAWKKNQEPEPLEKKSGAGAGAA